MDPSCSGVVRRSHTPAPYASARPGPATQPGVPPPSQNGQRRGQLPAPLDLALQPLLPRPTPHLLYLTTDVTYVAGLFCPRCSRLLHSSYITLIAESIHRIALLHYISSNFPLEKGRFGGFSRSFKTPLPPPLLKGETGDFCSE
ncbi:protein of unknown function [Candidatus Methylomirabilis oxygeniifera]|uniref:Uncharacterized protein n=1 Tax=Methylomirabilis oxygeniifera TaxID=671143 RepID=D5MKT3_METO1|nr:protein of unknown function [Candidatus Methylomirabilis oxyfera]